MSQEYEYIQRSADGPNYMSIAMTVMEPGVRGLPRLPVPLVGAFCVHIGQQAVATSWPPSRPLIDPDPRVCVLHPPALPCA